MGLVIGFALVLRLAVFWLPPILSDDAYRYVWDGLVQAEGYNPYLHTPDSPELEALHDEPVYAELNSPDRYTVYPPVSQTRFPDRGHLLQSGVGGFLVRHQRTPDAPRVRSGTCAEPDAPSSPSCCCTHGIRRLCLPGPVRGTAKRRWCCFWRLRCSR